MYRKHITYIIVYQIAKRDYRFKVNSRRKVDTIDQQTYDAIAEHFRKIWGDHAGWAHSVLFTADLRTFAGKESTTI